MITLKQNLVYKQLLWHKARGQLSLFFPSIFFPTGTKSKKSLKVQMICSLFNIVVIYFYESSLLLFTLNDRYILGSISHSLQAPEQWGFFPLYF